ncbi:unnamed protein product [Rotaria socialis]
MHNLLDKMTTDKRKRIQCIDSYDFETFARVHLPKHLADTLLVDIGITSYSGFIQCDDLSDELLSVHDCLNDKDRLRLFLYNNTVSSSSPNEVKKGVLRELNIFREECKKKINNRKANGINSGSSSSQAEHELNNSSKRLKIHYDFYQTPACRTRTNDIMDEDKFKYREKPIANGDSGTDWSFHQEEMQSIEKQSNDLNIVDNVTVKEATHIYVTQQRIHHFFYHHMFIKSEDFHKFVFLLQSKLGWHLEQLYQYIMKTRTRKIWFDQFINEFHKIDMKNQNMEKKVEWLVYLIQTTKYKPSGYSDG